MYKYKMVQVPPIIESDKQNTNHAAAAYLEKLANSMAKEGWEFYRMDRFSTKEKPGCFTSKVETLAEYCVITFRKEIVDA